MNTGTGAEMAADEAQVRGSFWQGIRAYFSPRIFHITLLGIASGLPFSLIVGTLTFWLSEVGIEKKTIGLFALVSTPYTIKFLWAPLIDNIKLPLLHHFLGRRRSWIILSQLFLFTALVLLGFSNPVDNIEYMAILAIAVATFSATQDIVIDAYRIEILAKEEQAIGAAASVFGWRLGALLSGAGTLYLAAFFEIPHEDFLQFVGLDASFFSGKSWQLSYLVTALILLPISLYMLKAPEPEAPKALNAKNYTEWLSETVVAPFREFMSRKGWWFIIIFIIFFKLGDAMALSMLSTFNVDMGFTKAETASISKLFGFWALLGGAMLGGSLVFRYGIMKGLLITGFLQMFSTLSFILLAEVGHDMVIFAFAIATENIASGMGTSVFVAYLSRLCSVQFTATQYALFSALAAQGRTFFAGGSGYLAEYLGWHYFFLLCSLLAIPGLLMIKKLHHYSQHPSHQSAQIPH